MTNYGRKEKYQVKIEDVDFQPELAGVRVCYIPYIIAFSIVPLWFDSLFGSSLIMIGLTIFFYRSSRREEERRPILLNARVLSIVCKVPTPWKRCLLPSLANLKPNIGETRR